MRARLCLAAAAALVASTCLLGGCSGAPAASSGGTPQPAPGATATTVPATAATPAAPAARVTVEMVTSKGVVLIDLRPDKAPVTVENFLKLVKARFFDGILIHRVVPGFVVQAGDPQTRGMQPKTLRAIIERQRSNSVLPSDPPIGTGGPGWSIPLETSDLVHDRGVIAMARSAQPDTAGSQFYITLAPAHQLDGSYAVFGAVTKGMDVVDRLAVGEEIRSIRIVR